MRCEACGCDGAEKDAEIERLKVELYDQVEKKQWLDSENRFLKSLITECADALDRLSGYIHLTKEEASLVQRAREATK